MNDLRDLLDIASRPASGAAADSTHQLATELRLGRRALVRRRIAAAGGGIAVAGLAVGGLVGGAALLSGPAGSVSPAGGPSSGAWSTSSAAAMPTPTGTVPDRPVVPLTNTAVEAGPFHFARTPAGWVAGPSNDYAGHLVPATGGVTDPSSFTGKITATVDSRPGQHSTLLNEPDGIWLAERPITVAGQQRTLSVQIPTSAGLSSEQVDRLVDGVTAGPEVHNLLD
ncbi:hypothetical protein [Knoellia sp. Soil729]|uniref:hypothetical protein n=1 Tax=Knoellia sp. Soil729 TaxID=1736394 RepID=UPI0006FAF296|nr:hypothetical protein [Knoellia sp. Soil729]KRE42898.1 hypothetical protein ASG74_11095 [Knoellia sp. Soil729]